MKTGPGLGEAGWEVDSGKRLFSYQRIIANAISYEHLCLRKINRIPLTPSLWGLISGMLAVSGGRMRLGPCSFTGVRTVIDQPAYTLEAAKPGTSTSQASVLFSALQLSTQLPPLLLNLGVELHRNEHPGLKELTDLARVSAK